MISIIIPTFKEAENIPVLIKKIDAAMKEAGLSYEAVIVDDDSNDGTIESVDNLKKNYNIKLKVRKNERGLSSAVIEGFKISTYKIIVVMDADLSHPPRKIPELVNPILDGSAEFAIGSRFVKGGSARHFNLYRKLNAWISKMLARPFAKVTDPMAGFFAFPKKIFKPDMVLNPLGFKIGLELLVKASPKNIVEIPIIFEERLYGESKLSVKEQVLYILHLKRLFEYKYRTYAEFIKFSMIGGSGMIVDLTFVTISMEIIFLPFRIARAVGFVFALTSNFLLNRRFTFQKAKKRNILRQYLLFFAVSTMGLAVNWLISVYLHEQIPYFKTHYLIASFIGILGGMLINFTGSKFIVFK